MAEKHALLKKIFLFISNSSKLPNDVCVCFRFCIVLWQREVIFLCWMQGSNIASLRHQIASSLNVHSHLNRLSNRGSSKNLSSTACPYDEWAFSPLYLTTGIRSTLAGDIHICCLILIVLWHWEVSFWNEKNQVVFLCWMQDWNLAILRHQFSSRLNAHSQTDWAVEDQANDEWAFSPLNFVCVRVRMCVWVWLSMSVHHWDEYGIMHKKNGRV